MGLFDRLIGRKSQPLQQSTEAPAQQAVLVYLRGSGLPPEVYEEYDLATLEDQLFEVIDESGLGEFDGNDFGPDEVILYMYASDAERLFAAVEPVLRAYPLCEGARVVLRAGEPGAPEREIVLAAGV